MAEALFHGGCFCCALSFSITSPPTKVYLCHCTDCQRLTGSAFAHNASFATSSIHVQAHEQAKPGWKADDTLAATTQLLLKHTATATNDAAASPQTSGAADLLQAEDLLATFGDESTGRQQFCAICGTRLFVRCRSGIASMRTQTVVPVGVIDASHGDQQRPAPTAESWAQRRAGWLPRDLGVIKKEKKGGRG